MSLLHQDDELDEPERELTLSTGALLGIFAGLVLLCALFFALGYTMRGRQTPRAVVAASPEHAPSSPANFNSFKPAAGSPVGTSSPVVSAPVSAAPAQPQATAAAGRASAASGVQPVAPALRAPAPLPVLAPIPAGSFIVQVAAVSHPEDAEFVVAALKAKGYPAAARTEPQDKLFHIQIGPYAERKDAEAIKQRLSADGYNNPIVK